MGEWNRELVIAARDGNVNYLMLCLENGADIEYKWYGDTALMWAARKGHLKVTHVLLGSACDKEAIDAAGWTAFMLAAIEGHLKVTQLLLERGCNRMAAGNDGRTALHLAAQSGRLKITRYLVEQCGISPLVRTHQGKTPYDLAAAQVKELPKNKKVVEYLQNVMSKDAPHINQKTSGEMQVASIDEDNIVPTEIKLMTDKRSVPVYLKLLESGFEKKRDVRLVIVGKKGAGKTSFIKRLFNDGKRDTGLTSFFKRKLGGHKVGVTSTNGIEIHAMKCKTKAGDCIWNKLEGNYEETELYTRLLKPFEQQLISEHKAIFEDSEKGTDHRAIKDITNAISCPEDTEAKIQLEEDTTSHEQQPNLSFDIACEDINAMVKSKVDLHGNEEYATLLVWDFAGDEEFYYTHQTFLSPDSIYLVVTKLDEADSKNAHEMFQLWMNSIHCYCRLEDQHNTRENNACEMHESKKEDLLDPPVVIIGSHKDKVRHSKGKKIEVKCKKRIESFVKDVSADTCRHIRSEYFVSNTKDDDNEFQKIKQDILNIARGMRSWNKDYPLKFIQLEKILQKKKMELPIPIMTFHELKKITIETPTAMNDEELILFLKFHHEIRALVYFGDLPDCIILDTQWLSNAFKCIITAEKFQLDVGRHRMKEKLLDLNYRGILHTEVVEYIFKDERNILSKHYKHKDDILNIMEKFDIIIPATRHSADDKPCYYVPCLVKTKPEYDIYEMFNVNIETCKKSTWLCFKFRFLPPHLINHLIASLSRKYKVAEVDAPGQEKSQSALFRGTVVFELQKTTKLRKLLLMECPNIIQIQILEFKKEIKRGMYKYIVAFVTEEINKIIGARFQMSNVKFEKKWECGVNKPESDRGLFDFSEEQITAYYCGKCKTTHNFTDEWADLQNNALCITKEEMNFTKMGMIVLNILADVLYDLLKQYRPNLPPRSDCDITYLYSEHRKLNKHIPSYSSFRHGPWGGNWQDIKISDTATGDDIERIRLTRNELQHSRTFNLDDKRFNELCNIIDHLLQRFDQRIKPASLYTDKLNETLAKTCSDDEVISIENEI
ncbi:uncharacterized protein [Mytilus edulis]|uniref:uncharacterized protein isoform X2 n=3 Tax=Mytilus edulis TaxID=6550 RepID=UPI0039EF9242